MIEKEIEDHPVDGQVSFLVQEKYEKLQDEQRKLNQINSSGIINLSIFGF